MLGAVLLSAAGQRRLACLVASWRSASWPGARRGRPCCRSSSTSTSPTSSLLAYWEGLENTVSVGRDADGVQTLFTNSRGQTNDAPDLVRYHRVMGHLAALLAPTRRRARSWSGWARARRRARWPQHAGAQVDVIELSESVISAAPFFRVANADVLGRPNVHLAIDDGRNYLLRNRQRVRRDHRRRRPPVRRRARPTCTRSNISRWPRGR